MGKDELAERRRRRAEVLAQRAAGASWQERLLARRRKYARAHVELARRISLLV